MVARSRLGFIVPSVNTVLEDELRELLPADVSYSCARVTLGTGDTRTQLAAFETTVPEEAAKLGDARVDALVLACTSASIMRGPEYDATMTSTIVERSGAPAISATSACVAALAALGAKRVHLLTPYEEWLHRLEEAYLRSAGLEISSGRLSTPPQHLGRTTPEELVREVTSLVTERVDSDRPDAVLVSCANARLFGSVAELEAILQVPVVTSNQAAVWAGLNLIGRSTREFHWGVLTQHSLS